MVDMATPRIGNETGDEISTRDNRLGKAVPTGSCNCGERVRPIGRGRQH
jgi:hypothetical protein